LESIGHKLFCGLRSLLNEKVHFQLEVSENKFLIFPPSKFRDPRQRTAGLEDVSLRDNIDNNKYRHIRVCYETRIWNTEM